LNSAELVTFLSITTDAPFGPIEAAREALLASLPDGFDAYTWKELNRSQFHSFTTTRTLLVFIMFLILLHLLEFFEYQVLK
jgi:lipoprotein-releasing system permease protein